MREERIGERPEDVIIRDLCGALGGACASKRVRVDLGERELAEDPSHFPIRAFIRDDLVERIVEVFAEVAVKVRVFNNHDRRGRIAGMDTKGSTQFIRAQVPMAEMLNYSNDLTAMTQGRASFTMEFDHYDFVPQMQAEKIIAAAKAAKEGVEEEEE